MNRTALPGALALMLLATVLLSACQSLAPERANPTVYQLTLDAPLQLPERPASKATLLVMRPMAAPGYDTRGIVYQTEDNALRQYAYARWADTPARMLQVVLVRTLERAQLFQAVVHGGGVPADYQLTSDLLYLTHDFTVQPSQARLGLRVQLLATQPRRVLGTRIIETAAPAPSDDPAGGVRAAQQAMRLALRELVDFTAQALPADAE